MSSPRWQMSTTRDGQVAAMTERTTTNVQGIALDLQAVDRAESVFLKMEKTVDTR